MIFPITTIIILAAIAHRIKRGCQSRNKMYDEIFEQTDNDDDYLFMQ